MPAQRRQESAQIFLVPLNTSVAGLAGRHGYEVIGKGIGKKHPARDVRLVNGRSGCTDHAELCCHGRVQKLNEAQCLVAPDK
jgi:hypothetical protein